MAKFELIEKDKYKIIGQLTSEDINKINSFKNRTIIVLENTAGLSSELISTLETDRVVFSIKGGLDYDKKDKYKEQKYIDRTYVSPDGLKKIIKYFEYNESLIDSNWNEFEKAMFLYNALVVDMEYAENYETIQSTGTTERSLNGILYGKLVCAGFAQVYKEMLDRIGIKNYYQNQKDVHAFNIIEIDGKKYGVDITWDNNDKKNNNGRCGFGRFGHDPEFYTRHGHQLYKDIDVSDDFELTVMERVYDTDEEVYDLSLIDMETLNQYYSHISSKISSRKPFKYNLQDQAIEIKNKYLPVDTVDLKLKKEATQEYPITIILEFLKKRNALQINPQLLNAYSSRRGYLLDIGSSNGEYRYGDFNLSLIGINNYKINRDGMLEFSDGNESKFNRINGTLIGNNTILQNELDIVCNSLNQYLNEYLKKYFEYILNNLDSLLQKYEYVPKEWDSNRAIENANIYSKLAIVVNSRDYLIELGLSNQEVDSIIQRITNKYNEVHKPYEKEINQKDNDLDFLYAAFGDLNMIWQTIEYDLQKQITEEEFIALFKDVDYMIKIFEQYVMISQNSKFKLTEYKISKEELQQLLNKIIQDNQLGISNNEQEIQTSGIKR